MIHLDAYNGMAGNEVREKRELVRTCFPCYHIHYTYIRLECKRNRLVSFAADRLDHFRLNGELFITLLAQLHIHQLFQRLPADFTARFQHNGTHSCTGHRVQPGNTDKLKQTSCRTHTRPETPTKATIAERASTRWCQAFALSTLLSVLREIFIVS